MSVTNEQLAETFSMMMDGDDFCSIHQCATVPSIHGPAPVCPQCAAENEAADAERIAKMNEDIAFADWHSRTDA